MAMSTFDTNTQIIQEETIDIDKDILFHGGIFERCGDIVHGHTYDIDVFLKDFNVTTSYWVKHYHIDFDGVHSFDPGTLTIHMRSSFVQMTGISTFILSSKLSCMESATYVIEHFRASCRSYIAKSNNPKLERQEFINRFFTDVKNRYIPYNQ